MAEENKPLADIADIAQVTIVGGWGKKYDVFQESEDYYLIRDENNKVHAVEKTACHICSIIVTSPLR